MIFQCILMHISPFHSQHAICGLLYYFTDFSWPIPLAVKESPYMYIHRYLYLCTLHIYDAYKFSHLCIHALRYCECNPIPYLVFAYYIIALLTAQMQYSFQKFARNGNYTRHYLESWRRKGIELNTLEKYIHENNQAWIFPWQKACLTQGRVQRLT